MFRVVPLWKLQSRIVGFRALGHFWEELRGLKMLGFVPALWFQRLSGFCGVVSALEAVPVSLICTSWVQG